VAAVLVVLLAAAIVRLIFGKPGRALGDRVFGDSYSANRSHPHRVVPSVARIRIQAL
jgi:hypothetical protein